MMRRKNLGLYYLLKNIFFNSFFGVKGLVYRIKMKAAVECTIRNNNAKSRRFLATQVFFLPQKATGRRKFCMI